MPRMKYSVAFWFLLTASAIGATLWLCDPKRHQPEHLGRLLSRLGPRFYRWHVRHVVAANKEQGGQMKARDYLRVVAIGDRIGKTIADGDLTELLRIMGEPSQYPQIVHGHVAARLLDVPYLSNFQKERVFQAFYPLLRLENLGDNFFLHQQQGIKIMKHLGDRRAIPHLVPLLKHPCEKIKMRAEAALTALGYYQ